MNKTIVVIGLGEMGGVFARGFLRCSNTIIPVNRHDSVTNIANQVPDPACVLISVGEKDLTQVLADIPEVWKNKLILLQNELLPRDWQKYAVEQPSVISVWFEKKPRQDYKVIIPSPVFGPRANIIIQGLATLNIACTEIKSESQMVYELVRKNLYILTTNIAGLEVGGTVGELWHKHNEFALQIANEIIDVQEWLTDTTMDRGKLIDGMVEAIKGDLEHKCMGRTAISRLKRSIDFADQAGIEVTQLRKILANHSEVF